jgi:hypothetical protein
MAVSTAKGVNVTLLDATPRAPLEAASVSGKVRTFLETRALVTADTSDDGDIWYMAEVPSNAKIVSIKLYNDVVDAHATPTLDANLGIYNGGTKFTTSAGTTYAADALIDENSYGDVGTGTLLTSTTSTFLGAANVAGVELAYAVRNINLINNYVWEDAGLPEDPHVPLRIAFTVAVAAATHQDGDISLVVTYAVE